MNTQEKIEKLEKEITELKKECQGDKLLETFKKFVGRNLETLAIRGENNYLITDNEGDLQYCEKENIISANFDDELHYEECILSDLERGDIFIFKDDCKDIEDIDLDAFRYFVGVENNGDYRVQHFKSEDGLEFISDYLYGYNRKVFKFLRE